MRGGAVSSSGGLRPAAATLALLAWAGCAFFPLEPGQSSVVFGSNEGLLVIHTSSPWTILELDAGVRAAARRVPPGEHLLLVRAPAGEYRWSRLIFDSGSLHWSLRSFDDPMWRFRVEPGKINYPGQIVLEPGRNLGLETARVGRSVNRSASMLALLETRFPALSRKLPIVYTGHERDDFPGHYQALRALNERRRVSPSDLPEPSSARSFFLPAETRQTVLSPGGRYAAFRRRSEKRELVYVYAPDGERLARARAIVSRRPQVHDLSWADDDTLLVHLESHLRIIDVSPGEDGDLVLEEYVFLESGQVVDPLPSHPESLLFAPARGGARVHRLALPALRRWVRGEASESEAYGKPVAQLDAHVWEWLADPQGRVRAALSTRADPDPEIELWFRAPDAPWKVVDRRPAEGASLVPLGFLGDDLLLVASDEERDRFALYEFDPQAGERGRLVYEHPTAQLVGAFFDRTGSELLGVTSFQGAERVYEFLDSSAERYRRVFEAFPGESSAITSLSLDGSKLTVLVTSPANPGIHYFLDLESGGRQILGRVAPWLRDVDLAGAEVFTVTSADGLPVEALLSLPPGTERPPLIVMPHGGPIGVRDEWGYDPTAQYLASRGFAVLKVNYRGSSGYGRSFLEAGKRQWGTGIEDDIDAAVQQALSTGRIDAERMCIFGASYGGYSALMSVIRRPGRYRCAASLAGVTDIGLMFNSSDFALSDWSRERFAEVVGDPQQDFERLRELSPVYRAGEIGVPVLLAHGVLDRRVDVEHADRFRAVMELLGKPLEWIPLPGAAHGFASPEQEAAFTEHLADFFMQHLSEIE